jgi:hypothetical protein
MQNHYISVLFISTSSKYANELQFRMTSVEESERWQTFLVRSGVVCKMTVHVTTKPLPPYADASALFGVVCKLLRRKRAEAARKVAEIESYLTEAGHVLAG